MYIYRSDFSRLACCSISLTRVHKVQVYQVTRAHPSQDLLPQPLLSVCMHVAGCRRISMFVPHERYSSNKYKLSSLSRKLTKIITFFLKIFCLQRLPHLFLHYSSSLPALPFCLLVCSVSDHLIPVSHFCLLISDHLTSIFYIFLCLPHLCNCTSISTVPIFISLPLL
jgi:hypothetical protein